MPDLSRHIRKMETMYEVLVEEINTIFRQAVLFTHTNEIKIPELSDAETYPARNSQDNGATPPLVTHAYYPHSPLTDTLFAPDEPTPLICVEARDAVILLRAGDLTDVCLLVSYNMLFEV